MNISDINFGKRFRKDLGDIDSIVKSIERNGLLYPIIVTADFLLIDGARRIKAYEKLGIREIPANIVNVPIKENGEIDANLVRKDFTVEEILAIKKYRELIEPNLQGKRTDLASTSNASEHQHQLQGNFPRSSNKRRQERIAKDTGLSYKSLERLEEVVDTATKHPELGDLPKKLDSRRISLNKAYKITSSYKKREQHLSQAKKLDGNKLPVGLSLIHGDCRQKSEDIPPDSIDLIFTDPPYNRKSLPLYADLMKISERVLRPGGSLVVYAPHYALLEIGTYAMQAGLKQVWTLCVKHTGHLAREYAPNILVNWKPLLWLVKGKQPNVVPDEGYMADFITSTPPNKDLHKWAQSPTEADYIIKNLTDQNQIVLDCFLGSGTTGIAALKNNRQFIGIEIDQLNFENARANILSSTTVTVSDPPLDTMKDRVFAA